jgi:OFA family oxalate/formate antiporter-like MFS transporter
MLSAGCGLMVIGSLKDFAVNQGGLTATTATAALGLLALFNGLGRVVWGTLGQKLTPKIALIIMSLLQGLMMFVLIGMGSASTTLTIAACWIGFNFGGNFALFPLLTAEYFGTKNLGQNYGIVFTAYGIGGIVGPLLAGMIWVKLGSYQMAFIPAGIACLGAMLLGILLKAPAAKKA